MLRLQWTTESRTLGTKEAHDCAGQEGAGDRWYGGDRRGDGPRVRRCRRRCGDHGTRRAARTPDRRVACGWRGERALRPRRPRALRGRSAPRPRGRARRRARQQRRCIPVRCHTRRRSGGVRLHVRAQRQGAVLPDGRVRAANGEQWRRRDREHHDHGRQLRDCRDGALRLEQGGADAADQGLGGGVRAARGARQRGRPRADPHAGHRADGRGAGPAREHAAARPARERRGNRRRRAVSRLRGGLLRRRRRARRRRRPHGRLTGRATQDRRPCRSRRMHPDRIRKTRTTRGTHSMSTTTQIPAAHGVRPRQPAPELTVPLLRGGTYRLDEQTPDLFTMVVFNRGLHCPFCRAQLSELNRRFDELAEKGIDVVSISGESEQRANQMRDEWKIDNVPLAYGLSEAQMREWGLFVSRGVDADEPAVFNEPALFLISPDGSVYYESILSTPVGRPRLDDLLGGIDYWTANDYPPRGGA